MSGLPRAPPATPEQQGYGARGGRSHHTPARHHPYARAGGGKGRGKGKGKGSGASKPRLAEGLCVYAPGSLSDNAREYLYVESPTSGNIIQDKAMTEALAQGDWQANSFVAGSEYMAPFKWQPFTSSQERDPVTGARQDAVPWGVDSTPFAGCKGKGAMKRLIFSAEHARKMSDEIRQNLDGCANLPLLSGPPNMPFERAHMTIYQVDAETPAQAYTAFLGPASFALQAHLRKTFDTSRAKVKTEGFNEQWLTVTAAGRLWAR